ncbi:MAG: phosphatase PAP2 family protein [Prevotella sp.]|nr:phosphatase PAP2 family protein [Prevotella sp.]
MKKILLLILPFVLMSCDTDDSKSELEVTTDSVLDGVLKSSFSDIVNVQRGGKTYEYLLEMAEEAVYQSEGKTKIGLPLLYQEKNFPHVYNYYSENRSDKSVVYKTMIGWLCAMQLSELAPSRRNKLYKAGYEAGGYTMNSNIYGYHFRSDPNVARLVASAVYAAMHTIAKPDINGMRAEIGGSRYSMSLAEILEEESRTHVTDDAFYVDLRQFMASAPGPYAPAYANRGGINPTFPDEKASNSCLKVDMDIYNSIVEGINLPDQRAVQAIADEDADVHHLFGTDKRNIGGMYDFNAVFGASTISETIDPEGKIAAFIYLVQKAGGSGRGILQHANASLGSFEYGRLRPGCSEQQEGMRKSYTDDRLNVLTSFVIEDNDGHKASYDVGDIEVSYYDENGNWTNADVQSAEQYENMTKDLLFANSYPSGHASGIWSAAMAMIELYPQKADLIMRAANDFAVSRTVSRFHWNSDVIQGKVVGSIMNPVCHAASDYNILLETARKECR